MGAGDGSGEILQALRVKLKKRKEEVKAACRTQSTLSARLVSVW